MPVCPSTTRPEVTSNSDQRARWPPSGAGCLALALGLWALSCGGNPEQASRIAAERARFRAAAPEQYVIAACDLGETPACSREVVIEGRVITAEVKASASSVWRPLSELTAGVDLVSLMFDAVSAEARELRSLTFERRWHFVSEYRLAAGGRRVTCFLPGRVALHECQPEPVGWAAP